MIAKTLVVSFALLLVSLAVHTPTNALDVPLRVEELTVETSDANHLFQVEVAETDHERSRGLMFRTEMADNAGMLFVFSKEGQRYFWMKNTPLPLDIIFINRAGEIVHIAKETVPFSETVIPSEKPAKYVLELNGGTTDELGISVGDHVSAPSLPPK
nr:DUF192 domain-containing protein [Roseibium sp. RKSG952]